MSTHTYGLPRGNIIHTSKAYQEVILRNIQDTYIWPTKMQYQETYIHLGPPRGNVEKYTSMAHYGAIIHTCPRPTKRQFQNIVQSHYEAIIHTYLAH